MLGIQPMSVSGSDGMKDFECSERIIVSTPYMSLYAPQRAATSEKKDDFA